MKSQQSPSKLYVKTYGCQMNFYDSARMSDMLATHGFETTDQLDESELVVLNTCHIREKAAEKVYSELGRIRKIKEARKEAGQPTYIAVAGCVAQAEGEEIKRRAPYVDFVVGPQSYQRLPQMIANAKAQRHENVTELDFATHEKFDKLPEEGKSQGASAFLTVQEGCDKFCTFCVVPYTRGAEFSRPINEVYREALMLVERGAKEITLLGQNVNAYHGQGPDGKSWSLGRLIGQLADIPGLKRIRYTTSHPRDVDEELLEAHRDIPELMPFLHLPVQAGSDKVLKEMNRKHTRDDYLRLIERFRAYQPLMQFSSDFIVGFPGESDADFEGTMQLVEAVNYAQAYSFKYSPRPGTPAATREDSVPEAIKSERLQRLQALLNDQQQAFNATCIGQAIPVLFDREGRKAGQLVGRSPFMQAVHIQDPAVQKGDMVDVLITDAFANGLSGDVVTPDVEKVAAHA